MSVDTRTVVEEMLAGLNDRDYGGFYDRLDPACACTTPSGVHPTPDSVKAEEVALLEQMDPHWRRVEHLFVMGSDVVTWVRFGGRVKATGKEFEAPACNVFTFDGDRIVEWREYLDVAPVLEAFA